MPELIELPWDSAALNAKVAQVVDWQAPPSREVLNPYSFVLARIPLAHSGASRRFETLGFRFVTVDYELHGGNPGSSNFYQNSDVAVEILRKNDPRFEIKGFRLDHSRFYQDPLMRVRLAPDFWDTTIRNHCREFADFVICAVDSQQRLAGCISCFDRPDVLELFLIVIHERYVGRGLGTHLVARAQDIAAASGKSIATNVIASNLQAINFYIRLGFRFSGGEVVMHYSAENMEYV